MCVLIDPLFSRMIPIPQISVAAARKSTIGTARQTKYRRVYWSFCCSSFQPCRSAVAGRDHRHDGPLLYSSNNFVATPSLHIRCTSSSARRYNGKILKQLSGEQQERQNERTTTTAPSTLPKSQPPSPTPQDIAKGVTALRRILDQHIVGHDDTKECIILGLVACEHVFLQGEPGTAKTYAAELAAQAAGLHTYSVQFHRDTRLQDLIGNPIIVREQQQQPQLSDASQQQQEPLIRKNAEIVRQSIERGGLLTAEVAVLDDLTRAPGEALNVLLRILNERTFGGGEDGRDNNNQGAATEYPLPLKCAIATANAPRDDMYVEPLDPANLDRFALQVQANGLIARQDWQCVQQVMDMVHVHPTSSSSSSSSHNGDGSEETNISHVIGSMDIVNQVSLGTDMRDCLVAFLQYLTQHSAVTTRNSLLTDRTFLVKAPRILRAHAAIHGRTKVQLQDMIALRHMTTFRVPPAVHHEVCQLLHFLAQQTAQEESKDVGGDGDDDDDDGNGRGGGKSNKESGMSMANYLTEMIQSFHRQQGDRGANFGRKESTKSFKMQEHGDGDDGGDQEEGEKKSTKQKHKGKKTSKAGNEEDELKELIESDGSSSSVFHASVMSFLPSSSPKKAQEGIFRTLRRLWGASKGPNVKLNLHRSAVSGAESVMAVLHGRSSRRRKTPIASSSIMKQSSGSAAGLPRERGRMQSMGDPNLFVDADAADIASWLTTPTASSLPCGLLRQPKRKGGSVALARDMSDSMWGPRAALASATALAAINLAKSRHMRFGYCEFAGEPTLYRQRPPTHHVHKFDDDCRHGRDPNDDEGLYQGRSSGGSASSELLIELSHLWKNQVSKVFGMLGYRTSLDGASSTVTALGGQFFGMDYAFCKRHARRLDTDGYTNLQEMLRQVLVHFQVSGLPPQERHLLIITDGAPTVGSTACVDEAALAKSLGVAIHPIFVQDECQQDIGEDDDKEPKRRKHIDTLNNDTNINSYPQVLKFLAEETNGVRFLASHEVSLDE